MSQSEEKRYKWLIRHVVVPIAVALVPLFAGVIIGKFKYERTLLPIQPNPSTTIKGRWSAKFADIDALEPQENLSTLFDKLSEVEEPLFYEATIDVDVDGPTFTATAMAEGRVWKLEGYMDGDSILYVYKDKHNPNSFGSAFLRKHGATSDYIGVWAGKSPEFMKGKADILQNPFLVRGWVKWSPVD